MAEGSRASLYSAAPPIKYNTEGEMPSRVLNLLFVFIIYFVFYIVIHSIMPQPVVPDNGKEINRRLSVFSLMSACEALFLHSLAAGQFASPLLCSSISLVRISLLASLLHCGEARCLVLRSRVGPGFGAADASNSCLQDTSC